MTDSTEKKVGLSPARVAGRFSCLPRASPPGKVTTAMSAPMATIGRPRSVRRMHATPTGSTYILKKHSGAPGAVKKVIAFVPSPDRYILAPSCSTL